MNESNNQRVVFFFYIHGFDLLPHFISGETPGNFHLILVNDSLEKSYATFRDFVLQNTGSDKIVTSTLPCIGELCVGHWNILYNFPDMTSLTQV